MISRLPWYYRKSETVKDLYAAIQKVLDTAAEELADEDKELFITTAEDFTLHEKDTGLSDTTAEDEVRRSRVIARLQGNGVFTVAALKSLTAAFGAEAEVAEDYGDYLVRVIFSKTNGQPRNIADILAAIEEVKPAHIRIGTDYIRHTAAPVKLSGVLQNNKVISLKAVDAMRKDTLNGAVYGGGFTEIKKDMVLEEADNG